MSYTKKYGFKVSVNQFHGKVSEDYYDESEEILIKEFEKQCLQLKNENKINYSMIEVGSNQCYYSLLFKHILGKQKTLNIMIEPHPPYFEQGKIEFQLNSCEGVFYNRGIGNSWKIGNKTFDVAPITFHEILKNNNLNEVDIIQADIDGSELFLLESESEFFKQHKTKYLFLGTHSHELHQDCLKKLEDYNYKIILNDMSFKIGYDSLIVAKSC